MPDQHHQDHADPAPDLTDPRPVARLFTDRVELLTDTGWSQLPIAGAADLNRLSLRLNEHLDQLGIPFDVAVMTSETSGTRKAWFELRTAATSIQHATTWPPALLQTAE